MEDERASALRVFSLGIGSERDEVWKKIARDALVGGRFWCNQEEGADAVRCYLCRLLENISTIHR